ncbi:recombinase family protein [Parasedimentitalea marina]|uniref:Recombinase family protein n=1 Tax=Parasedimentitalea marina TaxID=2483033 RepID=A0A3T0MZD9_9RHOB|nr:recombinase family protein [Parasedimentitalea marina]AZV77133.1 recombinase family protein [Parasedimentitalea marina]
MKTILYVRTSTAEQTIEHQETQAIDAGYQIDQVISDFAVSGVTVRFAERPQAPRLFDMLRPGDVLIVRWVDRLGRDYDDVTNTIRTFMSMGVVIRTIINGFVFDGASTDPVQKAIRDSLIAFMAATAQAQSEATKSAQLAGIKHALQSDSAGHKYKGKKPSYTREIYVGVQSMLGLNSGTVSDVAREFGLSRQVVLRIRDTPDAAERALTRWGM